jgi:hypothetical protein
MKVRERFSVSITLGKPVVASAPDYADDIDV